MFTLNCKGKLMILNKPLVMGILNVTPDSFYEGSRISSVQQALQLATTMIEDGAAILDIGGQSTRPGSKRISVEEETDRILPVIETIVKKFPDAVLSVDTYYSKVAQYAVEAGAAIINDISGGTMDKDMLETAGKLRVPFVCMHIKGTPETMQKNPVYENVTREVLDYFIYKTEECRLNNIHDVILDPGFGFSKTIDHNFQLLHDLSVFKMLDKPILAGLSRKSTVYKTLGITATEALNGTTVLNTIALLNGAAILRVHDVKEAVQCIQLVEAYRNDNKD